MENTAPAENPLDIPVMPQRWTGLVQAHDRGGFVAVGDYIDAMAQIDAAVAAERSKWQAACENIARDLRNHEMVRLGALRCLDAILRPNAMCTAKPAIQRVKFTSKNDLQPNKQ